MGHLVSGGCIVRSCSCPASAVVLFPDDGDGPVLRPDSSHDGPDELCKRPTTGALISVSSCAMCLEFASCGSDRPDVTYHALPCADLASTSCTGLVLTCPDRCWPGHVRAHQSRGYVNRPSCALQTTSANVACTDMLSQQNQALQNCSEQPASPAAAAGRHAQRNYQRPQ